MNRYFPTSMRTRVLSTKLGSLLLLFQRSPVVQMLFPEARVIAGIGLGDIANWTVATVIGLGAYDSVAGATTIKQLAPSPGSTTVTTAVGANLSFVFQVTGTEEAPGIWQIVGTLPSGLTHVNSTGHTTDSIIGIPRKSGKFPITIRAWQNSGNSGEVHSQDFAIKVGPAIITTQPASTIILSGGKAKLRVVASGLGITYQWYQGTSPDTRKRLSGRTSSTFTTPSLTAKTKYWVRVTMGTIVTNSATATVRIGKAPALITRPLSQSVNSGQPPP